MNRVVLFLGLLQFYAVPVWGAPSALIQIPTADVLATGHTCIDVAGALSTESGSQLSDWAFESGFGIPGSVELGFDTPLNTLRDGAFFVKKGLGVRGDLAAAVGVNGLDFRGTARNPYAVLSSETAPFRMHLGSDYAESEWRAMLGFDYLTSERLTLMADCIGGDNGGSSFGFNLAFGPDHMWGLMAGVIHENSSDDNLLYVNLGCTFRWRMAQ